MIIPDCSFYQDDNNTPEGVDFDKMKTKTDAVIIRSGQNTWLDPDFKNNWQLAKAAGLKRGAYWYYDSRSEPQRQAELWRDALDGDLGELPLCIDLEESYGGRYAGWRKWMGFIKYVQMYMPGKKIMIYTGFYYWGDNSPNPDTYPAESAWFGQFPLWLAWYTGDIDFVQIPYPWDHITLWQYTSVGDGLSYGVESLGIDLNELLEDEEWFLGEVAPPPVEPPVEPPSGETLYRLSENFGTFSFSPVEIIEPPIEPPVEPPSDGLVKMRVKHDQELGELWRKDLPEVMLLEPGHIVKMTEPIQQMMFEILRYGMKNSTEHEVKRKFRRVYSCHRAFNNNKGFDCNNHGPFADFINGEDLDAELPKFDKVRVCAGATLMGTIEGDMLKVKTLRGAVPIADLIANPHLFFQAVSSGENIAMFPQGNGDPVYIPLISNQQVYYPLNKLELVTEIADPFYTGQ